MSIANITKYGYNSVYTTYNKTIVSAVTPTVEYTNSCYSEEELAQMSRKNRPSPKVGGSREVYFSLSIVSSAIKAPKEIIKEIAS